MSHTIPGERPQYDNEQSDNKRNNCFEQRKNQEQRSETRQRQAARATRCYPVTTTNERNTPRRHRLNDLHRGYLTISIGNPSTTLLRHDRYTNRMYVCASLEMPDATVTQSEQARTIIERRDRFCRLCVVAKPLRRHRWLSRRLEEQVEKKSRNAKSIMAEWVNPTTVTNNDDDDNSDTTRKEATMHEWIMHGPVDVCVRVCLFVIVCVLPCACVHSMYGLAESQVGFHGTRRERERFRGDRESSC